MRLTKTVGLSASTAGNLASRTETQAGSTATKTYAYDNANQLTNDAGTTHTYDATGNRTDTGYSTGDGNRITSDGTWTYSYDNNGNVTTKAIAGTNERWVYDYDKANHLVAVKNYNSGSTLVMQADYSYDAFGLRLEKIIDADGAGSGLAAASRYAYDGWNPAKSSGLVGRENFDVRAKLDGSSSLVTQYLYSDKIDGQLGRIDVGGSTDVRWAITDYQGSIRTILDDIGDVYFNAAYDGFGNITTTDDPAKRGDYAWTGREYDVETGLQYNRARWYDPKTARWLTQDPLGFDAGDTNLYRYVSNRATGATDPSGLQDPGGDDASPWIPPDKVPSISSLFQKHSPLPPGYYAAEKRPENDAKLGRSRGSNEHKVIPESVAEKLQRARELQDAAIIEKDIAIGKTMRTGEGKHLKASADEKFWQNERGKEFKGTMYILSMSKGGVILLVPLTAWEVGEGNYGTALLAAIPTIGHGRKLLGPRGARWSSRELLSAPANARRPDVPFTYVDDLFAREGLLGAQSTARGIVSV